MFCRQFRNKANRFGPWGYLYICFCNSRNHQILPNAALASFAVFFHISVFQQSVAIWQLGLQKQCTNDSRLQEVGCGLWNLGPGFFIFLERLGANKLFCFQLGKLHKTRWIMQLRH